MIETYTKEQIEEAKLYFQGKGCYGDGGFTEEKTVKYSSILLAALEAAEKERDSIRDHLSVNLQRLEAARDYIDELGKERNELQARVDKAYDEAVASIPDGGASCHVCMAAIRKECADIAMRFFYTPEDSEMGKGLRAAIEGTD
jgi:hypothetical protein